MTAQDLLRSPQTYKLTVANYLTLHQAGAFDGLRTELIEGEITVMGPQAARHIFVKSELSYRLRRSLEELRKDLFVAIDGSVAVDDRSLPEPDIFLTSAIRAEGYVPVASVHLAIEVAVSSLDFDLQIKQRLYARHGIAEYWVADVNGRVIHQMWAPAGEAYSERREVAFGAVIETATIAGLRVETGGL